MTGVEQLLERANRDIDQFRQLGLSVITCSQQTTRFAMSFQSHRNHKGSMFGGSIAMAVTASGWIHCARPSFERVAKLPDLVIKQQEVNFIRPLLSDVIIECKTESAERINSQTQFNVEVVIKDERQSVCVIAHLEYRLLNGV